MKTLRWNLGIMVIHLGYWVRGENEINPPFTKREAIGRVIVQFGYWLRGQTPMKSWIK